MKTAHISLRVDVLEHEYIVQWEINTKRKHKRAKDHLHDTHSLRKSCPWSCKLYAVMYTQIIDYLLHSIGVC